MKNKNILKNLVLGAVLMSAVLDASPSPANPVNHKNGWGLGLMLGSPTGISAKYWLGGSNAVDFAVGGGPGLRFHADHLWGLDQLMKDTSEMTLDMYLGAGGVVGFIRTYHTGYYRREFEDDEMGFVGARMPFGIDCRLRKTPLEFGLELAPEILMTPYFVSPWLEGYVFVRFLFEEPRGR